MKYIIIILSLFILSGCEINPKPQTIESTPTPTTEIKKLNINFEISSFSILYEKSSSLDDERYNGSGIVIASGDADSLKKPYQVLLKITKTSGGDKHGSGSSLTTIIVNDGVGKFSTSDWNFDKGYKMEKPVYDIKVMGYIPFNVLQEQINKVQ